MAHSQRVQNIRVICGIERKTSPSRTNDLQSIVFYFFFKIRNEIERTFSGSAKRGFKDTVELFGVYIYFFSVSFLLLEIKLQIKKKDHLFWVGARQVNNQFSNLTQ
jgi:hypothetical protein